jgi:catechol-2,3-dioxygenase
MGHLALRVADVEGYVAHVGDALGLEVVAEHEGTVHLASGTSRSELQISAGAPGFDHVGLLVEDAGEVDAVVQRAVAAGGVVVARHDDGGPGVGRAVLVEGPAGIRHEIYALAEHPPTTLRRNLGGGIRRLGHLTFMSVQAEDIVRFWTEGLGFRISDRAAPGFTWCRCDAYHHTLAVGPHPASTVLHHHAWEAQDVTALTKHCDRNALAGRRQIWGPVRHGPGFNIATYMPEPSGALIEVYADLLLITDDENYEPVDWDEHPHALNLWGPMPSEETLAAGAAVAAVPIASKAG